MKRSNFLKMLAGGGTLTPFFASGVSCKKDDKRDNSSQEKSGAEHHSIAETDKMISYNIIKSVTALKSLDIRSLQTNFIMVLGYYEPGDGGGGGFYWDGESDQDPDGGTVVKPSYNGFEGSGRWKRFVNGQVANVKWYGAKADSTGVGKGTDSTAAIQKAMDNHKAVYFPESDGKFMAVNLRPNYGQIIYGCGKTNGILNGNGSDPIFKLGHYLDGKPDDPSQLKTTPRDWHVYDLNAYNEDAPVARIAYSPSITFKNCTLRTRRYTAMEFRYCFDITIDSTEIGVDEAKGGWCATFYDNCNGVAWRGTSRISGGSGGNGIDIALATSVSISDLIMEGCGGYGIRIAGNSPVKGNVEGVTLQNLYFERVKNVLEIGRVNTLSSAHITNVRAVNHPNNPRGFPNDFGIFLGRIEHATLSNFDFKGNPNGPFIMFGYNVSSGKGHMYNCEVKQMSGIGYNNAHQWGSSIPSNKVKAKILSGNHIEVSTNGEIKNIATQQR